MTNAQKLRERRNELLGEPKLEFGCEIKPKYPVRRIKYCMILDHFGGDNYRCRERIDTSKNDEEYQENFGHNEYRDYHIDEFEILGKPVTINDVLRMLVGVHSEKFWYMTDGGVLSHEDWDDFLTLNLSLTTVEDEPEETIISLLNLLEYEKD